MADLFFSEYIEGSSNNKALEIYNGTGDAIDLAAEEYVVQMYFNGNTTAGLTINLTGTVAQGDVFVLAQSSANATILAQADQTQGSGWFNGDDAVVLRKGGTTGTIVDAIGQIGFDPGSQWGSELTSTADNTLRRDSSITAGDTNPSDAFDPSTEWEGFATDTFDGLGSHTVTGEPTPTLSLTVNPTSFSEAAGASAATGTVTRTGDLTDQLTVFLTSSDTTEATVAETVTIAAGEESATFNIDAVDDDLVDGSQEVTLMAAVDNLSSSTTTITVTDDDITAGTIRIHDIQGAAHISPLVGQVVSSVPGIVTAVRSNGFYLQDPNPDADDATSEGIFVFTSSAPTVTIGDSILVSGTVSEFRPGGATSTNLTTTQIGGNPTITILSSGNSLPVATILGNGGRAVPTQVIEDDANGSVETTGTFDPAQDGIDFYESVEGMRVQLNNAVAVGPTSDFGEIPVVVDNGVNAGTRTARGGILVQSGDFNPERIFIDDVIISSEPQVNVGDTFNGAITGVIDYSFGNFKLLNTTPLSVTSGGLTRESTALTGTDDQLTVASFNVENLDPGDGSFDNLADIVVNNLKSPDIISLEEIQDNNGATNDSVVDADQTYQTLIDAIAAAGGPTYEFRQVNPVDDQDGGEPGGNIRVGFLFNPGRVDFVDRPGGGSTTNTTVVSGASGPELSSSVGRILDTDLSDGNAFANSRKPVVGEFLFNGNQVFVIGNHFNSKGGDQPLFGNNQPPILSSEAQRLQQAEIVNNFVESILAVDPDANVVVLGDFNDFQFSEPLEVLKGDDLTNLVDTLPLNEQYTYVFEGNSQALDHILVSDNLGNNASAEFDIVHLNAEFATQDSDHDPLVARFTLQTLINGTPDADVLTGTDRNEKIDGKAGNDTIKGGLGDDQLTGSEGDDTIEGNEGNDQLNGGLGKFDSLFGGDGNDTITDADGVVGAYGNAANDTINVTFASNWDNDTNLKNAPRSDGRITGGYGDDTISVTMNNNKFFINLKGDEPVSTQSQDGNDVVTLLGTYGNSVVDLGGGNDTFNGGVGSDNVSSGDGNDILNGGAGNDWLQGQNGDDTLIGGSGDDLLVGGVGSDTLTGGIGKDKFALAASQGTDTITDFTDGQDLIGLLTGLSFGQLTIVQGTGTNVNDTLINLTSSNELLAILSGVQSNTITSADFVRV